MPIEVVVVDIAVVAVIIVSVVLVVPTRGPVVRLRQSWIILLNSKVINQSYNRNKVKTTFLIP